MGLGGDDIVRRVLLLGVYAIFFEFMNPGIVLPGVTLICGDSPTCPNGRLGARAFGAGSSALRHALATPPLRRDLNSPARPVVAVFVDAQGTPLPLPLHLDLAQSETPSIVRTLSPRECRQVLGDHYPEWVQD